MNLSVDLCMLYTLARSLLVSKKTFRGWSNQWSGLTTLDGLCASMSGHMHTKPPSWTVEGSFQEHLGVFNQSPQ